MADNNRREITKDPELGTPAGSPGLATNFESYRGPIQPFLGTYRAPSETPGTFQHSRALRKLEHVHVTPALRTPETTSKRKSGLPKTRRRETQQVSREPSSNVNEKPIPFSEKRGGFRMMFFLYYAEVLRDTTFGRKHCATFRHVPVDDPYGFDPKVIRERVEARAIDYGPSLISDCSVMVMLSEEYGGNFREMVGCASHYERKQLRRMRRLYSFPRHVRKDRSLPRHVITSFRVALSFPWVTCDYQERTNRRLVGLEEMNSLLPETVPPLEYPRTMTHAAFAAMIPSAIVPEVVRSCLIDCHLLYMVKFGPHNDDDMSRKRMADRKVALLEACQWSIDSADIPNEVRLAWLVLWRVLEEDTFRPVPAVVEGAKVYRAL